MGEHTASHTPLPWKIKLNDTGDLCISTAEDEPWFIAEMCLGAGFDVPEPAKDNAALIVRAVNTSPAMADLVKALEKAEELYQLGLIKAPIGLFDEVQQLRKSALSRFRELEKGNV